MDEGCVSLQTVSNPGDTVRQSKSAAGLRDGGSPQGNSKSQGNNKYKKKVTATGLNVKELGLESDRMI